MIMTREIACSHYPTVELGRAVDFLDSRRRPITASQREAGNIPYFGANGVQGYVKDFLFDEPLILLAEDGGHFGDPARGIAYEVTGKSWVNNHAHVLKAKRGVDQRYLLWVLKHYDVTPFITGTTRAKLTKGQAEKIPVPLPKTLDEQRRIAAILDKADAIRRKREEAFTLADDFLGSVFLDMFGDPGKNEREWPLSPLGDLGDIQGGLQVTSKRVSMGMTLPYLRVANVYRDRLNLVEIKEINLSEAEFKRVRLEAGDILIVEGHGNPDEIGRAAIWDASIDPCVHQNHLIRFRADRKRALPDFISRFLNSDGGRRQLIGAGRTTSGLNTISTRKVKEVSVPLPPVALQDQFAHVVRKQMALTSRLLAQKVMANNLFAALSQRAFTGDL
jgi:type I restriction enzyme, S subunit